MPVYAEKEKVDGQTRWFIRTYIKDQFGNSKQITKHNQNWIGREGKNEALREEIRLKNQPVVKEEKKKNITLKELYNTYLEYLQGRVDDDTIRDKKIKLNHFCKIDESKQVKTYPNSLVITWDSEKFTYWKNQMRNKKYEKGKGNFESYSINRLNRIYSEVCLMIDYAVIQGYCKCNFARQAGKIGTQKEIRLSNKKNSYDVINFEEYKRLLEASKDNLKYNAYFNLAFTKGPRVGEVRAFRIKDFNYEKKQLMVNHTMSKKNVLKDPKTAASKAPIILDNDLNEKINELISTLRTQEGFNENWFIFGGKGPISSNAIENAKNKYFKLANINRHIRIHDFRHSCATWLFSIGIPITVVSKILRHASIDETMKTYTHLLEEDYNNNLMKIDNLLIGNEEKNLKQDQKQDQTLLAY